MERSIMHYSLSEIAKTVKGVYLTPIAFKEKYKELTENEQKCLINHYMIKGEPKAFENQPLLIEQILFFLAEHNEITPNDIFLIGSAKLGFTLDKERFGQRFTEKSDLDFSIVSESLFDKLKKDNQEWKSKYELGEIQPTPEEKKYWELNKPGNIRTINRGFIDSNKLPNRDVCPSAMQLNNSLSMIIPYLRKNYGISFHHASARVYKDYNSFMRQLKINTDHLLKT